LQPLPASAAGMFAAGGNFRVPVGWRVDKIESASDTISLGRQKDKSDGMKMSLPNCQKLFPVFAWAEIHLANPEFFLERGCQQLLNSLFYSNRNHSNREPPISRYRFKALHSDSGV
jgi:hypothetical protein